MKLYLKYFILFIIVHGIISGGFYYFKSKSTENYKTNRIKITKDSLTSTINGFDKSSRYIFQSLINKEKILTLMKNQDREGLHKELKQSYENLTKLGLKQLHFHLPNGDSFLRFHKPKKFGDNLFQARESVRVANVDKRFIRGFEEGKIFNGYRYVFPLFLNDKHIGSVETSVSMDSIIDEMEKTHGDKYTFNIKKSIVVKKLFRDLIYENYKPSSISSKYLYEATSKIPDHIKELEKTLFTKTKEKLNNNQEFSLFAKLDNEEYMSIFLPIKNIKEEVVAFLAVHTQNTMIGHINRNYTISYTGATLSLLLIFFFMFKNERKKEEVLVLNQALKGEVKEKSTEVKEQGNVLVKSSKMVVVGEMVGAIAHQWKQPLNKLGLIIQDLEDASEFDELTKDYIKASVQESMKQIDTISKTIDDFKDFLTPNREKENFNVSTVINHTISMLQKQLTKHQIKVKIDCASDLIILSYRSDLELILVNLVNNAKEAIVRKKDYDKSLEGMINITLKEVGEGYSLEVTDNGDGVSQKIQDKIFLPNFTTKDSTNGGVGLYISKLVSETGLGGKITFKEKSEGACFTVTFS
ncbi:MAG: ATP-binding protein [Campylobacterales bacterium]|nr:ATP-binding protein [Campylobacterales bacterium]